MLGYHLDSMILVVLRLAGEIAWSLAYGKPSVSELTADRSCGSHHVSGLPDVGTDSRFASL